jgi:hypothetical protein
MASGSAFFLSLEKAANGTASSKAKATLTEDLR